MTILSSIVPGVRELRTPLTSGLLWLAVIVVFGVTHHIILIPPSGVEIELRHLSSIFAAVLFVPAILTGALLLGNVMTALTDPLLCILGRWARDSILHLFDSILNSGRVSPRGYIRRQKNRFASRTRTVSNSARGLVMEANSRALAKVGVPGSAAMMFPLDEVINSLSFTAPQLSQTAETQYQEYDRVRSEVQFRLAIVPPIIALAAVLPTSGKPWVLIAAVVAGLILLLQAVGQERQSMDIVANALYLGYVTVPMVQSISEYLSGLPSPPEELGEWLGVMAQGLWERGYFEEADEMMNELAHLNEVDLLVLRRYLAHHQPEIAITFDNMLVRLHGTIPGIANESSDASAEKADGSG
jgi:hypothetical protein